MIRNTIHHYPNTIRPLLFYTNYSKIQQKGSHDRHAESITQTATPIFWTSNHWKRHRSFPKATANRFTTPPGLPVVSALCPPDPDSILHTRRLRGGVDRRSSMYYTREATRTLLVANGALRRVPAGYMGSKYEIYIHVKAVICDTRVGCRFPSLLLTSIPAKPPRKDGRTERRLTVVYSATRQLTRDYDTKKRPHGSTLIVERIFHASHPNVVLGPQQ